MKKKLLFLLVLAMVLTLALASCSNKEVTNIEIIDGTFRYEYEVGETVDLSGLKVKASYSDGSYRELTADKLELGSIDTSTVGTKQFTIKYEGKTLTIDVSVVRELTNNTPEVTLEGIAIDASSVLTKVKVGDTYSTAGIKATATYSDGTTKTLTAADLTVSAIDTAEAGAKTLTATYEGKSASLTVTVLGVKSIQVFGAPAEIAQGATLDTSAITAVVTFTDDSAATVTADNLTFGALDTASAGEKTFKVSFLDGEADVTIIVKAPAELVGIDVNTTNINQYITGIPEGEELDLAAIKAGVIVTLKYGYAADDVVRTEVLADNSALTVTELTEGSSRFVKIAYNGFDKQISILEGDPVVESIAIKAGSFTSYVKLGGSFDPTGLTITATLSNGSTVDYPIGTTGLTLSQIDTSEAGTKTLTATYEGLTATAQVKVLPVSLITLNGDPDLRVAKGGELDYSALTFTVIYSDGTSSITETVAIADMTVGAIDTAAAGNKTFTVSYKGGSCNVAYLVKERTSIALKLPENGELDGITKLQVGSALDETALQFTVTWSDGTTEIVTVSGGVTLSGKDALATVGNHTIGITYIDVTGSFQVSVNDYIIMGVSKPSSLTALEDKADGSVSSKIAYFLEHSKESIEYVVGDDNAFYFTLKLLALDNNDQQVTITNYKSASKIYIIENGTERLLEGDEYDLYIDAVDEDKNAFDFSEAAIGKTFKIATRPANGILDSEIAAFTRTHTFKVVNAWNVYSAKELHVMTNYDFTDGQVDAAHRFLDANGIARPNGPIAGVVLHNDIDIKTSDLPSEYLIYTGINDSHGNPIYNIYNGFAIFAHHVDYLNTDGKYEFTIHGNYYTVYSYGVPLTNNVSGKGNDYFGTDSGDAVSTSQLFIISNADAHEADAATYDRSKYLFNMENIYLMDDDPNNPTGTAEESARAMRGLIGIKMRHMTTNAHNIVIERYYISFFPDHDYGTVTLDHAKLYNAWQNHIFLWGDNGIQRDNGDRDLAPVATGNRTTLNITNSEITVCGGPVIIAQTKAVDGDGVLYNSNTASSPEVFIDDNTTIYTYVQASAAWFQAFNATAQVAEIVALNGIFQQGYHHSYEVHNPLNGYTGDFMNIIMLNMSSGYGFGGEGGDIDGTLTIGGKQILNMKDSNLVEAIGATMQANGVDQGTATQMVLGGYSAIPLNDGNHALDAIHANGAPAKTPIFQSTFGTSGAASVLATAYFDGSKLAGLAGDVDASHKLFAMGDGYLTLYTSGMGVVFGDFHAHTGAGDGYCK